MRVRLAAECNDLPVLTMETTRISTKGRVVLPLSIRQARGWTTGTVLTVEETAEGVLLRPERRFPRTTLADVAGCLRYAGKAKTVAQMDAGIGKEVKRRHVVGPC